MTDRTAYGLLVPGGQIAVYRRMQDESPGVHVNCSGLYCNSLTMQWMIDHYVVVCGRCHEARRLGDTLCCQWAMGMYRRYFEGKLV